jgi:putative Mg2+ transporter-C (MgtC) family protein
MMPGSAIFSSNDRKAPGRTGGACAAPETHDEEKAEQIPGLHVSQRKIPSILGEKSMDLIIADMIPASRIHYPVIFARLLGAIVFGALIGFEREARDRPAGFRTHILISLAAALFAIISIEAVHMPGFADDEQVRIDPLRVIEAVTAGVAFLAAGMIVFARGRVHGLTTGAGMWLSGAIGLAMGFGYWPIAFFTTLAAICVLFAFGKLEQRFGFNSGQRIDRDDHQ